MHLLGQAHLLPAYWRHIPDRLAFGVAALAASVLLSACAPVALFQRP